MRAEPKSSLRKAPTAIGVKYKWDRRIGSPRKLFRSLQDFLDEYQYEYGETRELKFDVEERGPIEGVAHFGDTIKGKKDFARWSKPQLIVGMLLALAGIILFAYTQYLIGAIILVLGIVLAATSRKTVRRVIKLRIAGESYRAGGHGGGSSASGVEVVGVVSDVRLTIEAGIGSAKGEDSIGKSIKNKKELAALENELRGLRAKVDELLPRLELPAVDKAQD